MQYLPVCKKAIVCCYAALGGFMVHVQTYQWNRIAFARQEATGRT
jgi:hypothetical protein